MDGKDPVRFHGGEQRETRHTSRPKNFRKLWGHFSVEGSGARPERSRAETGDSPRADRWGATEIDDPKTGMDSGFDCGDRVRHRSTCSSCLVSIRSTRTALARVYGLIERARALSRKDIPATGTQSTVVLVVYACSLCLCLCLCPCWSGLLRGRQRPGVLQKIPAQSIYLLHAACCASSVADDPTHWCLVGCCCVCRRNPQGRIVAAHVVRMNRRRARKARTQSPEGRGQPALHGWGRR